MNNGKRNPKPRYATANQKIVYEYFRLIKNKDISRLLDLFADDAIIHEPFSNIERGLQGKSAIESFLQVSVMANNGLQRKIEFGKAQNDSDNNTDNRSKEGNQITALVTFERGGTVQGRFTFGLLGSKQEQEHYRYRDREKKIQTLRIEFIK